MDATFAKFLTTATDADLRDAARSPFVGTAGKAAVRTEQAARRAAKRARKAA